MKRKAGLVGMVGENSGFDKMTARSMELIIEKIDRYANDKCNDVVFYANLFGG